MDHEIRFNTETKSGEIVTVFEDGSLVFSKKFHIEVGQEVFLSSADPKPSIPLEWLRGDYRDTPNAVEATVLRGIRVAASS